MKKTDILLLLMYYQMKNVMSILMDYGTGAIFVCPALGPHVCQVIVLPAIVLVVSKVEYPFDHPAHI